MPRSLGKHIYLMVTKLKVRDLAGFTIEILDDPDRARTRQVQVRAIVDGGWLVWREWNGMRSRWTYQIQNLGYFELLAVEKRIIVLGRTEE